jgi:hypothetical protein
VSEPTNRTGFTREKAWLTEYPAPAGTPADFFELDIGVPKASQVAFLQFSITTAAPAGNRRVRISMMAGTRLLMAVESQQTLGPGLSFDGAFQLGLGFEMQGADFWSIPLPDVVGMNPTTVIVEIANAGVGDTITTTGGTHWQWN